MIMTNNKVDEEKFYLLRLEALRRLIAFTEAEQAERQAIETEKAVAQYVVDNNTYIIDPKLKETNPEEYQMYFEFNHNSEHITSQNEAYSMCEELYMNDYLPKLQMAFKCLYNIDNPYNFVYSSTFRKEQRNAEQKYLHIIVELLELNGEHEKAKEFEEELKHINIFSKTYESCMKFLDKFTGKKGGLINEYTKQ